ncbi:putative ribosomal RNA processing protein 36 [Paratrimastix pyriformis]|uniref:Ribosomal RNA processing protein 36 n=1 Tax=Paratrimastix pyriformis TaxID=342808 RepID=A0ABQ8UNV0_9EUKA|nr:putative ribosomal RNA processing protein 36 [Paratrimastix pyriformis]
MLHPRDRRRGTGGSQPSFQELFASKITTGLQLAQQGNDNPRIERHRSPASGDMSAHYHSNPSSGDMHAPQLPPAKPSGIPAGHYYNPSEKPRVCDDNQILVRSLQSQQIVSPPHRLEPLPPAVVSTINHRLPPAPAGAPSIPAMKLPLPRTQPQPGAAPPQPSPPSYSQPRLPPKYPPPQQQPTAAPLSARRAPAAAVEEEHAPGWKPYTLSDYQRLKDSMAHAGHMSLGPDLQNEELLKKKAEIDKRREFERQVEEVNKQLLQQRPAAQVTPAQARQEAIHRRAKQSNRERALAFAARVPRPPAQPQRRQEAPADGGSEPEGAPPGGRLAQVLARLEELEQRHMNDAAAVAAIRPLCDLPPAAHPRQQQPAGHAPDPATLPAFVPTEEAAPASGEEGGMVVSASVDMEPEEDPVPAESLDPQGDVAPVPEEGAEEAPAIGLPTDDAAAAQWLESQLAQERAMAQADQESEGELVQTGSPVPEAIPEVAGEPVPRGEPETTPEAAPEALTGAAPESAETAPEEVAPQEAAPQEVAPQEVAPQEVAPQEAAPEPEAAPETSGGSAVEVQPPDDVAHHDEAPAPMPDPDATIPGDGPAIPPAVTTPEVPPEGSAPAPAGDEAPAGGTAEQPDASPVSFTRSEMLALVLFPVFVMGLQDFSFLVFPNQKGGTVSVSMPDESQLQPAVTCSFAYSTEVTAVQAPPTVSAPEAPKPTPSQLILRHKGTCFNKAANIFTYNFCIGNSIKQTIAPDVYDLGHYTKVETGNGGFAEWYEGGTPCDGVGRKTLVRYSCASEDGIVSISEPRMCQYELVFGLKDFCVLGSSFGVASAGPSAGPSLNSPYLLSIDQTLDGRYVCSLSAVPGRGAEPLSFQTACLTMTRGAEPLLLESATYSPDFLDQLPGNRPLEGHEMLNDVATYPEGSPGGICASSSAEGTQRKVSFFRPEEFSCKKPVNPFRTQPVEKKTKPRDPRFDPLCGHFDELLFRKSYGFLDQMKKKEIVQLRDESKKTRDPERQEAASKLAQRMEQSLHRQEHDDRVQEKKREFRKLNRDLIKQGKNPYYLKRGDLKKLVLMDQVEDLKKRGSLAKGLARKRQHLAAKQHLKMPRARRAAEEAPPQPAPGHGSYAPTRRRAPPQ